MAGARALDAFDCHAEERRQAHRKARTRTTEMADESDEEAAKAAERYARMRCDNYACCVLLLPGVDAFRTHLSFAQ